VSGIVTGVVEGFDRLRCRLSLAAIGASLAGIPVWLRAFLIAMVPILELRGAIPLAHSSWGMALPQAYMWAVIGNMVPIPFVLLFLEPVSEWLRRHSRGMDRFFTWLFERTRRKHSKTFEKWRYVALCLFVAIPLPGTGAWTGALAAFVFDVPFWPALISIFAGVLIAGLAVSLVVLYFETFPIWLTLLSALLMAVVLLIIWLRGRRETEVVRPELENTPVESVAELELDD
jgi:uncharacterized membrane protein